RLSSATIKPASTSTLIAIARRFQILLLPRAQIARQPVDRADEVDDGIERARGAPAPPWLQRQTLAYHIGLREFPAARLVLDLSNERVGEAHSQSLHEGIVWRHCPRRNERRPASARTNACAGLWYAAGE